MPDLGSTPARTFLTAEWRWLAMLNYEVDRATLAPMVPPGTELDTWEGRLYASMVGFLFLRTRVLGVPVPLHRDFEEVNLRFYVRRRGPEGWRRGVVFVREIVPRHAIAAVARVVYEEPYVALPMRHRIDLDATGASLLPGGAVEYGWRWRGRWNALRATTEGGPEPLVAGSEEEFVTEHYWGYTARSRGPTAEYRVEHPAWRTWRVSDASLDCDVASLYGARFVDPLSGPPCSAFVAEGSPIRVMAGARL
jgi:uncharacterized protein YqjF (DUF2071 family)